MPKHHHLVILITVILLAVAGSIRVNAAFGEMREEIVVPQIAYSTTLPTNQDVVATVTFDHPATISNNEGRDAYTFALNGSFTFTYVDDKGRSGSVTALVRNVDKEAPTALFTGTPLEQTLETGAVFTIGGWDVSSYRYRLDDQEWSEPLSVMNKVTLADLQTGIHEIAVVGCDLIPNCQDTASPLRFDWEVFADGEYRPRASPDDRGVKAIEISIEKQHLWAYEDQKLVFNTPVTTGSIGRDTTPGVFAVSQKHLNKSFEGGYFSRYWIRFHGGIGIHDATWRKEFGVDDYKWRGSRGCVNVAYDAAEWLYGWTEIGTSVTVE